jgi:hypothetical protein
VISDLLLNAVVSIGVASFLSIVLTSSPSTRVKMLGASLNPYTSLFPGERNLFEKTFYFFYFIFF